MSEQPTVKSRQDCWGVSGFLEIQAIRRIDEDGVATVHMDDLVNAVLTCCAYERSLAEDAAQAALAACQAHAATLREALQEAFDTPWVGHDHGHVTEVLDTKHRLQTALAAPAPDAGRGDALLAERRERLAAYAHDAWAGWMRYLFRFGQQRDDGSFVMDADKVARWRRQTDTPYAELSEAEKKSDRKEADEILRALDEVKP